ncbi:replication initiation protein RepM [Agitococcus lubricus]|uniref:Plasmid replication initiation protein n=1 Tax=Agitococcus lubricus TaxID=1077255 RepID=A0A2T5IQT4_9GAMM|nr:replication initiation protein RepM [Agitococcus lubricus]PTQ86174.1 plasmid replication initiation protein [Agitococcus lubricus]
MLRNELVVKSNRLIEASYRLDLVEQRIILFAIKEARESSLGLTSDHFLTIRAADYAAQFNVSTKKAYEQIKAAATTLYMRSLILHDVHPESGKERVTKARWVSAASYIDGEGAIQLQFSGVIVPYITLLEREFTSYRLAAVSNMSSTYAIRLYELLIQWGSIGKREVELNWLRSALLIEEDYRRLFDLKKWVIDVALEQINQHSDLSVSYSQRKTGRTVTHLTFTFNHKHQAPKQPKSRQLDDSERIPKSEIERLARPGETYEEAEERIRKLR